MRHRPSWRIFTARPFDRASASASLALLLRHVAASGYRFTTTTPLSRQRILGYRSHLTGTTLRDIFGWNLLFEASAVEPELLAMMGRAGVLLPCGSLLCSAVCIATIDNDFFLHSSHQATEPSAVFFGPDTYHFVRFMQRALQAIGAREGSSAHAQGGTALRILDVGCGSGAAGIVAARQLTHRGISPIVTMSDINPLALCFCAINAEIAGIPIIVASGDALAAVDGEFDLIIVNPAYLDDRSDCACDYSGSGIGSMRNMGIATEALARLAPGGHLLLYGSVAIIDGKDPFRAELLPRLAAARCDWSYAEIEPDVFGEDIDNPAQARNDRIAVIGVIAQRGQASAR